MSPPEVVAAIFEAGPGPASVLASQLVWIVETISHELATGLSASNTATTATGWTGLGGAASAESAAGLNTGLQNLIGWITHKVAVTQAAADAYLIAASTVIPALVSQTNRDETAALHATNFMGVNTPAIIERDTEYFGEHWPHNSSVGWTYSGAVTGLTGTLGVPPPPAPIGASPTAPAATSATVAQSATDAAAQGGLRSATAAAEAPGSGGLGSVMQQGSQLVSAMTDPVKSLANAPTQALQSFSSAPQALMSTFSAMRPTGALGADTALASAVSEPVRVGTGVATGVGGGAGGVGGYPGAALTSYTRPAGTFSPDAGGRPAGRAGVLNAAELRGPVGAGPGGTAVPMSPATGMLARGKTDGNRDAVAHARIVVDQTGGVGAARR